MGDGARDLYALGQASGELAGHYALALGEQELVEEFERAGLGLGMGEAKVAAMEVEVLVNRKGAVERVELGDDSDVAAGMGGVLDDVDAGDADGAAGGERAGGSNADGGGLSRAIGAEKAEDLPLLQFQIDAVDRDNAKLGLVDLGQGFNFDNQGGSPGLGGKFVGMHHYRTSFRREQGHSCP